MSCTQDELPEGEEEEEEEEDDDDEEEEDEMERYGSKPAKRPRSDFVIEEAGQLNYIPLYLLTINELRSH